MHWKAFFCEAFFSQAFFLKRLREARSFVFIKNPRALSTGMLNASPKLRTYTASLSNRCSTGALVPTQPLVEPLQE